MSLKERFRAIDEWGKHLPANLWSILVTGWNKADFPARTAQGWRALLAWRNARREERRQTRATSLANPATPKQIAYLTHLGVRRPERFDKTAASAEINRQQERAKRICFRRLRDRVESWWFERLYKYPELYQTEVNEHVISSFTDQFRSYVRSRVVGASGTLTQEKINSVIMSLTSENPRWWQASNCSVLFFERLGELHPNCLDGTAPDRNRGTAAQSQRGGCLGVLAVIIALAGAAIASIGTAETRRPATETLIEIEGNSIRLNITREDSPDLETLPIAHPQS